ncbi:MAG TPA: glucose 1-dehydrogenase [Tepidiformaceae bacterium]|nr:glucose 1-dehydrogenase [Tepidiformaceae bacterium]
MTAPDFSLEGRTAIVTGGSRGIGFAIAAAFIALGARVVITARGEEALREAERALGPNAIGKVCDNADPEAIARTAAETWALGPVDVLVNNAGISPYYKPIEFYTVDEYDSVMDVNLRGTYRWSVEIATRMFEAGRPGSIVNISSVTGTIPLERVGVYAASKAGIDQMTRMMALEWANRGVRVNAISPGWTETDFTDALFSSRHGEKLLADIPMGRYARPEDVTGAAVFLASEASAYVTGAVLLVDGGRSLR